MRIMLGLLVGYMLVELVGGYWSGSLALVADAGHMVSDAAALAVVLLAMGISRRPASPQHTFGFHRAEVLAASLNGSALLVIAGGILVEAWDRLAAPTPVQGPIMLLVAIGGLAVNGVGLWLFHRDRNGDLNLRGAWLHVVSDALGSVGAIVAGILVWWKNWTWADPAVSAVIALLVIRSAKSLLDDAVRVLMEGAPPHIDVTAVRSTLLATPGVLAVHDLHVWTITSGQVSLSAHLVTENEPAPLLTAAQRRLRDEFGIDHSTIQIEPPDHEEAEAHA